MDGEPFTWEATVNSRTRPNRAGCPGCAGHVPTDANNLRKWCEDNGEYGQKIVAEWAEPDVNMKDVTPATNKKLLWRCSSGCTVDGEPFTWESTVNSRTVLIVLGARAVQVSADGCKQPTQVVPGQRGVRTEARCRVGGAGCEHEGRDARDKQEALVEVLVGMHGGRGAIHVGVNGEQSHQF